LRLCGEEGAGRDGHCGEGEPGAERPIDYHPLYSGLDLSQEGRISLPTTLAAASPRLGLAYFEAAVGICDAAIAAAGGRGRPGGRGSPAADDSRLVPLLELEADARAQNGMFLHELDEEWLRSLELLRQVVELRRQVLRTAAPGQDTLDAQGMLASQLTNLGILLKTHGSEGIAEVEACMREAFALYDESLGNLQVKVSTLMILINLCGEADAAVGAAEAEVMCSRLNQLLLQMGREPETSCSICLEPLAPPAADAGEDAAGSGGKGPANSCVCVLYCTHQFHHGCLSTWERTAANYTCPICRD